MTKTPVVVMGGSLLVMTLGTCAANLANDNSETSHSRLKGEC